MKKLRVMSLELKVKGILRKLFTFHFSLFTSKKGFTLIEIIIILLISAIAIPALLVIVGEGTKQSVDAELQVTATNVAQQLLEEIKTECWDEQSVSGSICRQTAAASTTLGPEAGETALSLYDDVDDFNDLAPATLGTTPCTDTVTVNSVTFTRQAVVCYVNPGDLNTCVDTPPVAGSCNRTIASGSQTDYKKITVTVTAPAASGGSSVVLTTVATNY